MPEVKFTLVEPTKKRIAFFKNMLTHSIRPKSKPLALENLQQTELNARDTVKVRPRVEIQGILDDWGGTKGCIFTPEMYERCDNTYKVLKKVDYFYDEVKEKMCKCKDIFILKGAVWELGRPECLLKHITVREDTEIHSKFHVACTTGSHHHGGGETFMLVVGLSFRIDNVC